MENRNYYLDAGDVVLIQNGGYGFEDKDEGKYVEVIGFGDYFGEDGVAFQEYDKAIETKNPGCDGVVGYGSFGDKPMILLNTNEKVEMVNNPKHYALFDEVQAIEVIARSLTKEEFRGYCFGNLLKYRLRCGKKDNVEQELAKADKYKELYEKYKDLCHNG